VLRRLTFPLFAALLVLAGAPVSRAQNASDQVRVRFTSFAPWTAPGRPLTLGLEITNPGSTPLESVAIKLDIHDRVRSRSALRVSLDGNPQGDLLAATTEELDTPIAPGETRPVTIERDLGSLATSFRSGRARSGVYPIAIRVLSAGRTLANRAGAFVFLASTPDAKLNLVWVFPIHRPAAYDTNALQRTRSQVVYDRGELQRDLSAGGRLRVVVDALAAHPGAPVTLAPSGQILDELQDVSDGFTAGNGSDQTVAVPADDPLAKAAKELLDGLHGVASSPGFELATTPYSRADLVSLVGADLPLDARRQVETGRERVQALLGHEPSATVFVDGSYDADTRSARTLSAVGATVLVLRPDALRDKPGGRFGPDRPEEVSASGLSFEALIVDDAVRKRMEGATEDPVLTAQGVLAETAASYFELPGLAAGRLMVMATDGMPQPGIVGPLLDALPQAPWLRMVTASGVAADATLQPQGESQALHTARGGDVVSRLTSSRGARFAVDTLGAVVTAPADATLPFDRLILTSESADYIRRAGTAGLLARAARSRAEDRLARISVPARRVTLTARGGQLPVTIVNGNATGNTPWALRLRIRLDSAKVAFPHGATRIVAVAGRLQTVTFALQARTAGTFPIQVRLETADGARLIGTAQMLVQSTAVSAVTLMATAGGALFLIGAWARRAISRRRKGRAAP
jgi:hypothetical protein